MERVRVIKTTDGGLFETREDAVAHENQRDYERQIETFLNKYDYQKGHRTQAKNVLMRFLVWRDCQELEI